MEQQDNPDPELPELVLLLIELQANEQSVRWKRKTNELTIVPRPSPDVVERIEDYFLELRALLPGQCDVCDTWSIKRHEAYWGKNPHFCDRCWDKVMTWFRSHDWPPIEIPDQL